MPLFQHQIKSARRFWQRWLSQRMPAQKTITLNQRRIFIIPTAQGLRFLFVMGVLFLLAVNYQNALVFALCFFLLSVFIVCIFQTFLNLHALVIKSLGAKPGFVKDEVAYHLAVSTSARRSYHALEFLWESDLRRGELSRQTVLMQVSEKKPAYLNIKCLLTTRGLYHPGRLRIRTVYPLGLLQSWSWLDFAEQVLVYPQSKHCLVDDQSNAIATDGNANTATKKGSEGELFSFRKYQPGDPLKWIMWRSLARAQPLMSKQYRPLQQQQLSLNWYAFAAIANTEKRLSHLCYLALAWQQKGYIYDLLLPDDYIAPGCGEAHLKHVLRQLALY